MKRPMATLGFSFFMSLIMASFLELKMTIVLAALFFVAFIAGLFIKSIRDNRRVMTVLFAAMAAFSMYSAQEIMYYRPLQKWDGRSAVLQIETIDFVQMNNSVTVRVMKGDLPQDTRLTLWISGSDLYPQPYDILEGEFMLNTPSDSRDGQIRGYSKAKETYLNAHSVDYNDDKLIHTSPVARPWMNTILQARRTSRNTIMSQPEMENVAGLMAGIAFGYKGDMSSVIKYNFKIIGVSHLLAVSGLHVAILSQALLAVLIFLRVKRRIALGISCAGVVFFMALTGFEPSILRAGIMCLIFLAGQMIGREPDSLNSLGFSVLVITILNPYAVNDIGLLLSFAATYGILVIYPFIKNNYIKPLTDFMSERFKWVKLLEKSFNSFAITLSATIPTLPVILFGFGQISIISPIANLLMVFPTSIVMVLTCAAVPLYHIEPLRVLASAAFWCAKWVASYLITIADWLTSLPAASLWVRQTFLIVLIPSAFGFILLGRYLLGRHGMRITALWSVISLLFGVLTYNILMYDVTDITLLNAGNATAMLLERDGRTGVILIGDDSAVDHSVRELERRNVRAVDFLMIPNLNDKCALSTMILTSHVRVNCLITGPDGKYIDTVDALKAEGRLSWKDGSIAFWNDCVAEYCNGWLMVKINQTRLLLSPYQSATTNLTGGQRQTNLAVFTGKPPKHVSAIQAQAGVLCCSSESLSAEIRAFPRGSYPIYDTSGKSVTILTRGMGDITFKRRSLIVSE